MNEITDYKYPTWRHAALFSAIAALCHSGQFAYADTTTQSSAASSNSPFIARPFNLIDEFSTKPEYDSGKPSVMLLIADTATMNTEVKLGQLTEENVCKDAYTYLFANTDKYYKKYVNIANDFRIRFYNEEIVPPDGCRMIMEQLTRADAGSVISGTGSELLEFYRVYLPDNKRDDYIKKLSQFPSRNPKYPNLSLKPYLDDMSRTMKFDDNAHPQMGNQYYKTSGLHVNKKVMKAHLWFKNIPSLGRRSDITTASLKKVLNKYGDKLDWNFMSVWGSENWDKTTCAYEMKTPVEYAYGGADPILNKLPKLFGPSYRKYPGYSVLVNNLLNANYLRTYAYDPLWYTYTQKDFQDCNYKVDLSGILGWSGVSGKPTAQKLDDDRRQAPIVWRYLQAAKKSKRAYH